MVHAKKTAGPRDPAQRKASPVRPVRVQLPPLQGVRGSGKLPPLKPARLRGGVGEQSQHHHHHQQQQQQQQQHGVLELTQQQHQHQHQQQGGIELSQQQQQQQQQ